MANLYIGNESIGGGGLLLVDTLPTANQSEYNKKMLYLMNGNLYYIVYSNGNYSYKQITSSEVNNG